MLFTLVFAAHTISRINELVSAPSVIAQFERQPADLRKRRTFI